jgi:hypothetical protein
MKTKTTLLAIIVVCVMTLALPGAVKAQTLPAPQTQTVSGDQLVVGQNYILKSGQTLNGDLVILGGNGIIEAGAKVNGDIVLIGGNLDFSGETSKSIVFIGANVTLRNGSIVRGDINSFGGNLEGEQQATIYGQIYRMSPRAFMFDLGNLDLPSIRQQGLLNSLGGFFGNVLSRVMQIFGMAVLALLLALVIAKPLNRVSKSFTAQPWLSGGVGLLTLLVGPVILVILSITIILLPVTLLAFFALGIALVFGWIAVGYWVGQRMAVLFKTEWADAVSAGLGTLVLGVVAWLLGYVWCIGWLLTPLVACLGLGGVILSRFGTQEYVEKYPAARPARTVAAAPQAPIEPEVKVESEDDDKTENSDEPSK